MRVVYTVWDPTNFIWISVNQINLVVYGIQVIPQLFSTVLSIEYRWLISLETHLSVIFIKWMIILVISLPAIVTNGIYFRESFFSWVPKKYMLHIDYTIIVYYLIPIVLTIVMYHYIYVRLRLGAIRAGIQRSRIVILKCSVI